jgi:YVTN family beta-propeller protein
MLNMKTLLSVISLAAVIALGWFYVAGSPPNAFSNQEARENAEALGLTLVADIPLPGGDSRFDYQSIDPDRHLLFITHLGADSVIVFDLQSQRITKDIADVHKPHGVLAVPELNKAYASEAHRNDVVVIDEDALRVVKRVKTGRYPDGIAYDPVNRKLFVSDEAGKTVTVIDAHSDEAIRDIGMGGEVGNTQYDPVSRLIYSADQTNNRLVAIDPRNDTVAGSYPLPGCRGAHGFYVEPATHYALVTCEDNHAFLALDLDARRVVATDSVGGAPDVLAFDHGRHRLYVASESGVVSVFDVQRNAVRKTGERFLGGNAHTVSVDQQTHRIYLPLRNVDGRPVLRVMEPK